MQASTHFDLYRVQRTQVNEAHHNGPRNCYPSYQSDAVENVYYWYDGYMPYCTDSTVWQPLDDNFHLNLSGYSSVDKFQGTPHQLMNIHRPLAAHQESMHSYTLQLGDVPPLSLFDSTSTLDSPTSPCTSLSSSPWSDSESSPTQCRQPLDGHDTASISGLLSAPALPIVVPSMPKTAPPAYARQSLEAPGPGRPSIVSASPPAPDSSTPGDTLGRRVPKQRRVTRAVQPLACFFCRGRKIACGPPAKLGSGDRTCEPCARRRLVCEYPAESYRGRRSSGPKATPVKPQRR